jgi:hypothetical protein
MAAAKKPTATGKPKARSPLIDARFGKLAEQRIRTPLAQLLDGGHLLVPARRRHSDRRVPPDPDEELGR